MMNTCRSKEEYILLLFIYVKCQGYFIWFVAIIFHKSVSLRFVAGNYLISLSAMQDVLSLQHIYVSKKYVIGIYTEWKEVY
jgi:hypothetical protein